MVYKCLIVGLGQIGMGYDLHTTIAGAVYTHARAVALHPEYELVAAVEKEKQKQDAFKEHYGLPVYSDIAAALRIHNDICVVVIATPTECHGLAIKEVLANVTPKIILCEKPLAYDLDEGRELVESCERANVKLLVNYMRRADPGVIDIKARIDSGQIAAPIKGVAWYSKGFLHNGSHLFNLLEFWLGSFVDGKIIDIGRSLGNQDSEPDIEVEYERGKVIFISAWEEFYSHYTIELISKSGRLFYDRGGELISWQSTQLDPSFPSHKILKSPPEIIENGMNRYQWHVLDQVANALKGLPFTLSTGRQSLATLESMHKIMDKRSL